MHWVVVGSTGMLGQDMLTVLGEQGRKVQGLDRAALDVTDSQQCLEALRGADAVVNCAAWTDVDLAEERESDAFAVNALGAANLARAATVTGARLVHVSTDHVFRGDGVGPYAEDDAQDPVSAYGRTKAAGEWAVRSVSDDHLIVRTAWLYGAGGPNFLRAIARVAAERGSVEVVDDQRGQPTWSRDVAELIVRLFYADVPGGFFHATSSGEATWFEFAREVVSSAGLDPDCVQPTASAAFVRPAPRSANSVLGHEALIRAGVAPIGPWAQRWQEAASTVLQSWSSPSHHG